MSTVREYYSFTTPLRAQDTHCLQISQVFLNSWLSWTWYLKMSRSLIINPTCSITLAALFFMVVNIFHINFEIFVLIAVFLTWGTCISKALLIVLWSEHIWIYASSLLLQKTREISNDDSWTGTSWRVTSLSLSFLLFWLIKTLSGLHEKSQIAHLRTNVSYFLSFACTFTHIIPLYWIIVPLGLRPARSWLKRFRN